MCEKFLSEKNFSSLDCVSAGDVKNRRMRMCACKIKYFDLEYREILAKFSGELGVRGRKGNWRLSSGNLGVESRRERGNFSTQNVHKNKMEKLIRKNVFPNTKFVSLLISIWCAREASNSNPSNGRVNRIPIRPADDFPPPEISSALVWV